MSAGDTPFLYDELASWWHLFSPPSHYVEEAKDLLPDLLAAADSPPRTLLELGAGAGSLAYHLKDTFQITLTDRAPRMLEVSRNVNPECEHILGDMKRLDLRKVYDLVLVHDAIMYAADRDSLATVLATAYRHLRLAAEQFLSRTMFRKRLSQQPSLEGMTTVMDEACVTSSGRGTPIQPTPVMRSIGPLCFATRPDLCKSNPITTSSVCFRVPSGSAS
jgi:SAM-dependent methyltransferase